MIDFIMIIVEYERVSIAVGVMVQGVDRIFPSRMNAGLCGPKKWCVVPGEGRNATSLARGSSW